MNCTRESVEHSPLTGKIEE